MGERIGKAFPCGYPCLQPSNGIDYPWPSETGEEFRPLFDAKKSELGEYLLEQTKKHMETLDIQISGYPYLQDGMRGLALHTGDGGRWFGLGVSDLGNCIAGDHNLDSYRDRILAFSVISDALEFLDHEVKAARIVPVQGEDFRLEYTLPVGNSSLPVDRHPNLVDKAIMQRRCDIARVGKLEDINVGDDSQVYRTERGIVRFENGQGIGESFRGFSAPGASWLIARMLGTCDY